MSIAPPSDIVLDVAQAADPVRLQEATARLARLAAGVPAGSEDFGAALSHVRANTALVGGSNTPPQVPDDRPTHVQASRMSPYQKFEALVLQNFVETMLPKDDNLFGDAASASACRSMLADQLANQLARSGRIGIAQSIQRAHDAHHAGSKGDAPAAPAALPTGASTPS